jgi:protocadherin Fat 4
VLDKNDSPPSFQGTESEVWVSEEVGVGGLVAQVRAVDPDTVGQTSYSIVSGSEGRFILDPDGSLRLRESLDRETKDTYRLQIRASDGLQASDTFITIKVNYYYYSYRPLKAI